MEYPPPGHSGAESDIAAASEPKPASNRRVSPFLLNHGQELLPLGPAGAALPQGVEASSFSAQTCAEEARDKVGSRLHEFTRAHFREGLRVQSIQERASQYTEHWAHTDDTGAFHLPLASPQINSVRSLQDHVRVPTASTPAARAVRAVEDHWYHAPPSTPAIQTIRSLQEDAWAQPTATAQTPTVAQVRSIQEEFFPGINDVASIALAVASASPHITSEPRACASQPQAASYRTASSIRVPTTLLHSPLLSVSSDAASPHITVLRQAEDAPQEPLLGSAGGSGGPLPAAALGATTAAGANVWGACAGAVQEQLGPGGGSGVCGPEDASAVLHVLARAAVLAAVRREEEQTFRAPRTTSAIETIREDEEVRFKVPCNTPQVQQVRQELNGFRSVPSSPAIKQFRALEEGFRSPNPSATSNHMIAMLRAAMDDPFGLHTAGTPGHSRQPSTSGVAKHRSLPHPSVAAGIA